jgi:hypothetical protein
MNHIHKIIFIPTQNTKHKTQHKNISNLFFKTGEDLNTHGFKSWLGNPLEEFKPHLLYLNSSRVYKTNTKYSHTLPKTTNQKPKTKNLIT